MSRKGGQGTETFGSGTHIVKGDKRVKDLRQDIEARQTGTLESILNAIPGYGGYRDKQLRRDVDRLLREHIVRQLAREGRKLPELQRRLLDEGHLGFTGRLERVARRLQTLMDQIRTAASGYSGFFDAVKIREAELDKLYEFDEALLQEIPQVGDGIAALETAIDSEAGIAEGIRDLDETVDRLSEYWRTRQDAVLEV